MAHVGQVPAANVAAAEFRDAMGHFATGVTVVTSVGADGAPVGTTANAVTSLSLDPPLILVCFDLDSLTLQAIRGHGAFVVNVLAAAQRHLSANFARRGLAAAWDEVRHRHGPTGSPRLEDVLAVLECTVEHRLPGGDHAIVVGRGWRSGWVLVYDTDGQGNPDDYIVGLGLRDVDAAVAQAREYLRAVGYPAGGRPPP